LRQIRSKQEKERKEKAVYSMIHQITTSCCLLAIRRNRRVIETNYKELFIGAPITAAQKSTYKTKLWSFFFGRQPYAALMIRQIAILAKQ
jgi:hypothetical protein